MRESEIKFVKIPEFILSSGKKIKNVEVAYETHGTLDELKSNVILVFHALSGSAHISGTNSAFSENNSFWTDDCHLGWWDSFVGENKPIDSNKNFVICMNILGGCYGTTGPNSINSETGKPYGSSFPDISVEDMVRVQKKVLDILGVKKVKCVLGSSLGGYMALEFSFLFPNFTDKSVIIASAAKTSSLNKLHNFEQILAIENDSNFSNGDYYFSQKPTRGLMLARMIAAKSYVDIDTIAMRAREEIADSNDYDYCYKLNHHIESYMFHQSEKFTKRFDANTYLKICKAIQDFDIGKKYGNGNLKNAFSKITDSSLKFLVVTIDSDVCFYPSEQREIVNILHETAIDCTYMVVSSEKGHDSFLLEPEKYGFLKQFIG